MSKTNVITLMFHRVNDASLGYEPAQFARYLDYLVENFPIVTPGETLPNVPLAICLTFDDAYYDFYLNVYPLLIKNNIKAVLAVPVKYIVEKTCLPADVRLSVPYAHKMEDPIHQQKVPFCTWQELDEMAHSGHVVIASHGFAHANLADKTTDLSQEINLSQYMLEQKLKLPIKNFIYPFGRISSKAHQRVCETYKYGIRIGNALNRGWGKDKQFIYRINADPLWTHSQPFCKMHLTQLMINYWINRVRYK